ncbi:MAG: hypothetical protein A2X31_02470 [Elusimicrobia bacterium GWB2_63_22]|nr:MAG: hypothetical protein A2X31_02470 [Elusimicrobia bacterium GWB2_63_22]
MDNFHLNEGDIVKNSLTGELLKIVSFGPRTVKALKIGGVLIEYQRSYLAPATPAECEGAQDKFVRAPQPETPKK